MKTIIVSVLLALSAGSLAGEPAHAQANVALGAPTSPPIGWVQFCQDNAGECVSRTMAPATITLTETSWRRIVKINADVNKEIQAITDQEHWGSPEVWSYPTDGKGDCEDYVLEKRRRLVEAGFPLNALLITVVRDLKWDGHAVLTVKTDRGDFILDNQESRIKGWTETGYKFVKRQSEKHPNTWVSLGGVDPSILTANR
jgi:predicted transglutaminase-like cysteine proteinase